MKTLDGHVAVVAGATRGAGRGIARMLGEAGATVYCTGRSSRTQPNTTDHHYAGRPETIEETAELVTAAGGVGIPVRVDHTSTPKWRRCSRASRASRSGSTCWSTSSPAAGRVVEQLLEAAARRGTRVRRRLALAARRHVLARGAADGRSASRG